MKLLISGVCGFVGSALARWLLEHESGVEVIGFDNFIRAGSELNRRDLQARGVKLFHADVRSRSDIESLPKADWVIDAAANASVLAGVDGRTSSRQIIEHNLLGTIQLLEFCKAHRAGFLLLSTSRVYSIPGLCGLEVESVDGSYRPVVGQKFPDGISVKGVSESYSTAPPVSIYGTTKLCSEQLALEYGEAFDFPVWINRCGVLAGAGQFGRADQGIFSFWINSYLRRRPLKYIGFNGSGCQARDCFHPNDLARLVLMQLHDGARKVEKVQNVAGGIDRAMSLAQLSDWCAGKWGGHEITADGSERPYDIPWMVLDSRRAAGQWNWRPEISLESILEEIAAHAQSHTDWLEISG